MRPIVLVDCDGVMSDFTGAYLIRVEMATGRCYHPKDLDRWELWEFCELTNKEQAEVEGYVTDRHFCASLEPIPGAREGVEFLREVADVYCVTTPWDSSRHWENERRRWLREHMGFDYKHVIQGHDKRLVFGDVLVDDKPSNVIGWASFWASRGHRSDAVLWSHNTNKNVDRAALGSIPRTNDWSFVRRLVEERRDQ